MSSKGETMEAEKRFETPGSLAIMLIYLAVFGVMWLLAFFYLTLQWAVS